MIRRRLVSLTDHVPQRANPQLPRYAQLAGHASAREATPAHDHRITTCTRITHAASVFGVFSRHQRHQGATVHGASLAAAHSLTWSPSTRTHNPPYTVRRHPRYHPPPRRPHMLPSLRHACLRHACLCDALRDAPPSPQLDRQPQLSTWAAHPLSPNASPSPSPGGPRIPSASLANPHPGPPISSRRSPATALTMGRASPNLCPRHHQSLHLRAGGGSREG